MNFLRIKLKLVQDWKEAHKWLSVHLFGLLAAASGAWYALPPDLKAAIPTQYVSIASCALAVLGIVARVTDQSFDKMSQEAEAKAEQTHERDGN